MHDARRPLTRRSVAHGFDAVADTYDVMVGLNPGYHRHLRTAAEALLDLVDEPRPLLLDLGCGTGLSTAALLAAARERGMEPTIVGVDASAGMLEQARRRDWPAEVTFRHARAEQLAELDLPRVDGVLACYLLRNVPDVPGTLTAIATAMADDAPFVAMDYSVAGAGHAQRRWSWVNKLVITPLSAVVARQRELYDYLHRSVDDFASIPVLMDQMADAGFRRLEARTVDGWQRDILHLVRGRRG